MSESMTQAISLTATRQGLKTIAPIAVIVVPFGMTFGVAATGAGLPAWAAIAMSASVMAGGAQFAALDLWNSHRPLAPIVLMTLAINSRHVLYGASLGEWLRRFPARWRYPSIGLLSDPNWAATGDALRKEPIDVGFLLGSGLGLWMAWISGTALGLLVGDSLVAHYETFGLDTLLVTYFAALLIPLCSRSLSNRSLSNRSLSNLSSAIGPLLVAAAVTVIGRNYLPAGWNVVAAGLAGGAIGFLRAPPESQAHVQSNDGSDTDTADASSQCSSELTSDQ